MTAAKPASADEPSRLARVLVRVVLPLTLVAIGVALLIVGRAAYNSPSASASSPNSVTGVGLMGSMFSSRDALYSGAGIAFIVLAVMVWLLSFLLRMNAQDASERAHEQTAREYFIAHGRWAEDEQQDRSS